jgi:hypothetical protein
VEAAGLEPSPYSLGNTDIADEAARNPARLATIPSKATLAKVVKCLEQSRQSIEAIADQSRSDYEQSIMGEALAELKNALRSLGRLQ